jgi:tRNA-dihydrouridine synthase A
MDHGMVDGRGNGNGNQRGDILSAVRMWFFLCLLVWSLMVVSVTAMATSSSSKLDTRELFSVAPLMGHTHRHYRYFFRHLSRQAHLYTEMIPASQIVQAYEQGLRDRNLQSSDSNYHPDRLLELFAQAQNDLQSSSSTRFDILDELLRCERDALLEGPVHLQLGGRDPEILAKAAAIGAAYGYDSINLNCGCPSNSVSGRATGAALMREPELVARCVEHMSHSVDAVSSRVAISVKHRLGVRSMAVYNAQDDREQGDEEAFATCHEFCRIVSLGGNVSKFHVHARLGLLEDLESTTLWVPSDDSEANQPQETTTPEKINHKRAQYAAKRRARKATIDNRNVPPLRPNVVNLLAGEFPHLEFVTNGGIQSVKQVQDRVLYPEVGGPIGAMVGRAVINHPCSFASVDSAIWGNISQPKTKTREQLLKAYIEYCEKEEARFQMIGGAPGGLENARRKLTGVPFHLFVGEDGSDAYQRRISKLAARAQRHSSHAMLAAALAEVPESSRTKLVTDFTPHDSLETYEMFVKRSGPLQRSVY